MLVAVVREPHPIGEEPVLGKRPDQPGGLTAYGIALLRCIERLTVVQPREEVLDVGLGGVLDQDDGEVGLAEDALPGRVELGEELARPRVRDDLGKVGQIGVLDREVGGQRELPAEEAPDRREPLLAVDDCVDPRRMLPAQVVEVDLRNVVAVQKRVDEELLLLERPDRTLTLVRRIVGDRAAPG